MWEERRDEFPDFMDIPETFQHKNTKYQAVKIQQVGFYYLSRGKKSELYMLALSQKFQMQCYSWKCSLYILYYYTNILFPPALLSPKLETIKWLQEGQPQNIHT